MASTDLEKLRKIRNIALITALISGVIFFIVAFMAISENDFSSEKYKIPIVIFGGIAFVSTMAFLKIWKLVLKTKAVKAVATA
jgi:hypothetical protein